MLKALRHPEKSTTFGFFILLQTLLFIPAMLVFSLRRDAFNFAVGSLTETHAIVAAVITLLIYVAFIWYSNKEALTLALPLSFVVFPLLLVIVFTLVTLGRQYQALPYEWGKYPKQIIMAYSLPMIVVSSASLLGHKLYQSVRR